MSKKSKKPSGKKSDNAKTDSSSVTLIHDPFAIRTLDISEIQQSNEEIDEGISADDDEGIDHHDAIDMSELVRKAAASEDKEEEESEDSDENDGPELEVTPTAEETYMKLAEAIADQVSADATAALELLSPEELASDEERAAAELAKQIAEDQALQAQDAEDAKNAELDPELRAALPQPDENGNLDLCEVQSCMEAILFISDKPMSLKRLHDLIGPEYNHSIFQEAMTALRDRYQSGTHHGIELVEVAGGLQFRTRPGRAALARKLSKVQTQRLSSGAMESLAIMAYKQPCMKEDIDKIRGVDSSYFIRGLLDRKLIRISGRSELPGRPMLYSTTDEFLEIFGLKDLNALPPLAELESMIPASEAKDEEDPRVKQMRKMVNEMNLDTSTTLTYDPREDEKILSEMKQNIASIPVSTPYLDEQKAVEKAEKEGRPNPFAKYKEAAADSDQPVLTVDSPVANGQPAEPEISVADQMAADMVAQSLENGEPLPSESSIDDAHASDEEHSR